MSKAGADDDAAAADYDYDADALEAGGTVQVDRKQKSSSNKKGTQNSNLPQKTKQERDQEKKQDKMDRWNKNPLQIPIADRDLICCRKCHRIVTRTQFFSDGCKNCDTTAVASSFVPNQKDTLGGDDIHGHSGRQALERRTTTQFYGHVGVLDGQNSWIARFIGVAGKDAGVYAAHCAKQKPRNEDEDEDFGVSGARGARGRNKHQDELLAESEDDDDDEDEDDKDFIGEDTDEEDDEDEDDEEDGAKKSKKDKHKKREKKDQKKKEKKHKHKKEKKSKKSKDDDEEAEGEVAEN